MSKKLLLIYIRGVMIESILSNLIDILILKFFFLLEIKYKKVGDFQMPC